MSVRTDVKQALDIKLTRDGQNTTLSNEIKRAKESELVKNATILGQEAGKVEKGFKNLETAVSSAGTFEAKGEALVELTDQVDGLGKAFDRTAEINLSVPEIGGLFGEGEGSLENLIAGLGDGDSASLLDGLTSTVEAIGGDIAGQIAQIITLLTGLGAMLDNLNAAGISGSGMDALSKTGETIAAKADGLMGTLETAAGSLSSISDVSSLSELTGTINNFAEDISNVAGEISAIQSINPASEFTNNLLQDDAGGLSELGKTFEDAKSTVDGITGEVNSVLAEVDKAKSFVDENVSKARGLVNEGKTLVGDLQTGGGKLQDLAENTTLQASGKINDLLGATSLRGTGVSPKAQGGGGGGSGSLSKSTISNVIKQTQSGAPVDLAKAVQTVGGGNVGVDPSIKPILAKQKGFSNTRELVEKVVAECRTKGIDPTLISDFVKVMGVVEVGVSTIDTTITDQIKVGSQERSIWKESFDVVGYPREFDTFQRFETGEITAATQANSVTVEKKPIVFQTCDTKEELQAEVRLFKREIRSLIIHSTESFKNQYLTAEMLHEDAKARGFPTIQYHYVIRRDGTMQRGIPTTLISELDPREYRNTSINIAMVGGIDAPSGTEGANSFRSGNSFTLAQYQTLDTFLDTFFKGYPGAKVYGYGELVDTTNEPYFNVEKYVQRKFGKIR